MRTMKQGPLSDLIDQGAGVVKGIGRNLPIIGGLFKQATTVAAPASIGVALPQSTFNFIGRPQQTADYDTTRGVRISGSGLFTATLTQVFTPAGVTPIPDVSTLLAAGATLPRYYVAIVPQNVDPRLAEITKTFQFYAFRVLDFVYVPSVGTQTQTSLVLAVSQDAEEYLQIPSPFQTQGLEMNTAMFTPAWQTATMRYEHPGTKTWKTNLEESGAVADFYQAQLCGIVSSTSTGTGTGFTYAPLGKIYVKYVIDLYEPQPVEVIVSTLDNPDSGFFIPGLEEETEEKEDPRTAGLRLMGIDVRKPARRGRETGTLRPGVLVRTTRIPTKVDPLRVANSATLDASGPTPAVEA